MTQFKRSSSALVLVVLLAFVGAQAVHWLLTPAAHPDASTFRTVAVIGQGILGFGAAAIVFIRTGRPQARA